MSQRKASRSRGGGTMPPSPTVEEDDDPSTAIAAEVANTCWLCARPLGRRVEWHHPTPKSRGGRATVPVHPICHRTIHSCFSNAELARFGADPTPLGEEPKMRAFLGWVAGKPPDFHAPTRGRR